MSELSVQVKVIELIPTSLTAKTEAVLGAVGGVVFVTVEAAVLKPLVLPPIPNVKTRKKYVVPGRMEEEVMDRAKVLLVVNSEKVSV
ncbi:MAG: hypothetical protein A2902_00010 [Elusimicrobia bacterium RIFCSPLOWO2_01_FULL_64_13]|nr:MAG: hypothetical protein A2636_00535 [Elusimicrobia bacterium RIFCSPHIGHO2_01_FULL_64_10]OGR97966.1 MAG: hypothetical protein A2902_00010 [Elusimicrobia bacterium RIFCSPLOWO2_01_FULL_64_13]